jgi:uroporphyrinogen decarboxylase
MVGPMHRRTRSIPSSEDIVVLSKRDRVEAALDGRKLDRIPVSAWEHLIPEEADDATFAKAQVAFFREFDWDWLKINNRATLFTEAW